MPPDHQESAMHILSRPTVKLAWSIVLLMSVSLPIRAGSSLPLPIFTIAERPENFEEFSQGKLGIIHGQLYRPALFAAYRSLSSQPFSATEQQALLRSWQNIYERTDVKQDQNTTALNNWLAARQAVSADAPKPDINAFRQGKDYASYANCTPGAFDNARKILAARISRYTAANAFVKEWLQGQDQVFANCAKNQALPNPAPADAPAWLKQDRAYQIAAAHFYAEDYTAAQADFSHIAQDPHSEWQPLAAYLLARVAVRKAADQAAIDQINAVLANSQLAAYHNAAKQLANYVNFRLQPRQRHAELAKLLVQAKDNPQFYQDLTDYRRLLDKAELHDDEDNTEALKRQNEFRQDSDLSDWIFTVQAKDDDKTAFSHALVRWQSGRTLPWLVASLLKAPAKAAAAAALIAASASVGRESPAYLTVNYHAVRLLMAQGKNAQARAKLDALLAKPLPGHAKLAANQFYGQRLLLAQTPDEFVKYAQRQTPFLALEDSYELVDPKTDGGAMFDADATSIFNVLMPLSVLKTFALHPALPKDLKSRLLISVWTRAVLLGDDASAVAFAPHLGKYLPTLKPFLKQYQQANTPEQRHTSALWLILNNPAMRPLVNKAEGRWVEINEIDDFRDNWWCDNQADQYPSGSADNLPVGPPPAFLTAAELKQAAKENAQITALTGAANYLTAQTLQWAKASATDPRIPEALYLAVRTTRYGCTDCATKNYSKAAFELLAHHYRGSVWQRKTPYWFGRCDQ
ncbi:hypothetical protein [Methylovulum psychrotolerans]|uniref:hypothetical protein n=1 Tax=Methylovulum psychrotolerans TaxID=1704499 RepID=UPI0012FCBC1E|nr:hypothetical protein [Methylovulum psychrotolerans]